MRSRSTAVAALVTGLLVGGAAAAAPAAAATPRNCPAKHVCLYDGANWSGSMKTVGCSKGLKSLGPGWYYRATSVINKCASTVVVQEYDYSPELVHPVIADFTNVGRGQWADLGGARSMDNSATHVHVL